MANIIKLEKANKVPDTKAKKSLGFDAGKWLIGSQRALIVTHKTAKSITLEYAGVSLGKHFGGMHEHKPS